MKYHTISEAFKTERQRAGLTQERFAELLNTNRHRIIYIESGKILPDTRDIIGACRVFGIKAGELLCLEERKGILDEIVDGLDEKTVDLLIEKFIEGLERRKRTSTL